MCVKKIEQGGGLLYYSIPLFIHSFVNVNGGRGSGVSGGGAGGVRGGGGESRGTSEKNNGISRSEPSESGVQETANIIRC